MKIVRKGLWITRDGSIVQVNPVPESYATGHIVEPLRSLEKYSLFWRDDGNSIINYNFDLIEYIGHLEESKKEKAVKSYREKLLK